MKWTVIILLGATFFFSCKEKDTVEPETPSSTGQPAGQVSDTIIKPGLPPGVLKINGYFYASRTGYSESPNRYINAFAAFSKTRKNLAVNYNKYYETNIIDTTNISNDLSDAYAGDVSFNTGIMNYLQMRPATYILVTFPQQVYNGLPNWYVSGNAPFYAMKCTVPRDFPRITVPETMYLLTDGQDFIIALDSISNYDSLSVSIQENATYKRFEKKILPGSKTMKFTASEITQLNRTSGFIKFEAYNYSTKAEGSRLYLFELANKYRVDFDFKP